jgi:hypothetical protein
VHGAAFNLSLILRKALGAGKPRQFQSVCQLLFAAIGNVWETFFALAPLFPANQSALWCKAA